MSDDYNKQAKERIEQLEQAVSTLNDLWNREYMRANYYQEKLHEVAMNMFRKGSSND